jgi:hypothetical protein
VESRVTRAHFLEQSAMAALAAAGLYGLVDGIAARPARALATPQRLPAEQHLLRNVRVVAENGVEVVVPPLHHQIVTARLDVGGRKAELLDAQRAFEAALARIDRTYAPTPAGLGVTVGWGRSYFRHRVPSLAGGRRFPDYLPVDRRASRAAGKPRPALLDSVRFPSDPDDVVLEQNELCLLFRSDVLEHIVTATRNLLRELNGLIELTSIRKGFVGGGLPKRMAVRAAIPGAELIPDTAQLFLGFTSTQRKALGPELIANTETLRGLTDQWPDGYFRHGTTMHVSHLHEDLVTWYSSFSYIRRVWAAFRPDLSVADGTLTVDQGPPATEREADVAYDAVNFRLVGHSGALQPATRLADGVVDNYGAHHAAGTALIQRADFNTLDNPFFWSSRPRLDRMHTQPSAGLHFVAFAPTSDSFHRARLAMDGRYAGRPVTPFPPRAEEQGMNSVLRTTHRQNFLVPPRRHRSFPLVELL